MVGAGGDHVEAQGPVGFGHARVLGHVAQGLAVGVTSGSDPLYRLQVDGVVELTRNAQKIGQIEMPEPQAVDAVGGCDPLDSLQASLCLDLHNDEIAGVSAAHLGGGVACRVVVVRKAEGCPASPFGRVVRCLGNGPRLVD